MIEGQVKAFFGEGDKIKLRNGKEPRDNAYKKRGCLHFRPHANCLCVVRRVLDLRCGESDEGVRDVLFPFRLDM